MATAATSRRSASPSDFAHDPKQSWTVVCRRKFRRQPKCPDAKNVPIGLDSQKCNVVLEDDFDDARRVLVLEQIDKSLEKVKSSPFFAKFLEQMQSLRSLNALILETCSEFESKRVDSVSNFPDSEENGMKGSRVGLEKILHQLESKTDGGVDLVLYGIGSIANSEISRCQFSLALLLRKSLPAIERMLVYDPILSALEQSVLEAFDCSMLLYNEQGGRYVSKPTLFYMPHCEVELYDNLLRANWNPDSLGKIAVLGNSFKQYRDMWPLPGSNMKSKQLGHLLKIQNNTEEHAIEDFSFPLQSAFNDMSWHFFSFADGLNLPAAGFQGSFFECDIS